MFHLPLFLLQVGCFGCVFICLIAVVVIVIVVVVFVKSSLIYYSYFEPRFSVPHVYLIL